MFKIDWNKKYFTISLYVCAVLALTIIGVTVCVYLPSIFEAIGSFLRTIASVFYGLILAYFINPLLSLTEKRILKYVDRKQRSPYIKRIICLIITYTLLVLIIALFSLLIFPQLIQNYDSIAHNLSTNITNLFERVRTFLLNTFGISIGDMSENIEKISAFIINYLREFGSSIGRGILNFTIGLILSFFILLHNEQLRQGAKKLTAALLPARAYNGIMKTVDMSHKVFGQFFIGKIFGSLILGVITLAVLGIMQLPFMPSVFKMPYFLLIAAVVCITNIIPYVGPILGTVLCVLLVFVDNEGGFTRALILLIVIVAVHAIDGNLISPKIIGKSIGISSMWVVISILVLGNFMGVFGMFIAVPLFTIVYNLVKDLIHKILERKNLSTKTSDYVPDDKKPSPAQFAWETVEPPTPDPDLLSDVDEDSMEELSRRHYNTDRTQRGGDGE